MSCRTGCPTKDHANWGECLRASNLRIAYSGVNGLDLTTQKKWDKELADYKSARDQGIQPAGTKPEQVKRAVEISNKTGVAYQAG
jgi:hypothetical protein